MAAPTPITVAIARFEDLVALGLRTLLADDPSVSVVAHDIVHDRIGVVVRAHRPAVLILDVALLRDLAEVRDLRVRHPQTRLVLLGADLSAVEAAQLLAFGAGACLPKSAQARDVLHAIHLSSRGLQLMPLGTAVAPPANRLLTRREGEVLVLLRQDLSNAEVALALHIGVETVRSHARSIYRKLGVSSRRALMVIEAPVRPDPPVVTGSHRRRATSRASRRRPLHD
ncbi:MAG: response regulator transcription factor [Solirubrobacteraceae bacterium]